MQLVSGTHADLLYYSYFTCTCSSSESKIDLYIVTYSVASKVKRHFSARSMEITYTYLRVIETVYLRYALRILHSASGTE